MSFHFAEVTDQDADLIVLAARGDALCNPDLLAEIENWSVERKDLSNTWANNPISGEFLFYLPLPLLVMTSSATYAFHSHGRMYRVRSLDSFRPVLYFSEDFPPTAEVRASVEASISEAFRVYGMYGGANRCPYGTLAFIDRPKGESNWGMP